MEQKKPSPILLSSAFRKNIKIIKNINNSKNLTTFHSLDMFYEFEEYENILFCFLLTNIGQDLLKENKKIMGNGLYKFQPNDYNNSKILDFRVMSNEDISKINKMYERLYVCHNDKIIKDCGEIFKKYMK